MHVPVSEFHRLPCSQVRWRQEEKAKEEAIARADKEKRAKEQAEAAFKRREEATRRKADQDKQRLRDDVERLTQELSSLRAAESANLVTASWDSPVMSMGMVGGRFGLKEHERLAQELAELQDSLRRLLLKIIVLVLLHLLQAGNIPKLQNDNFTRSLVLVFMNAHDYFRF